MNRAAMRVEVVGAGVAGLTAAFEIARQGLARGVAVTLVERVVLLKREALFSR